MREAVERVTDWERMALDNAGQVLQYMTMTDRLALEIAVTDAVERRELAQYAERAGASWQEQETIAEIADDLLIPEDIRARLRRAKDVRRGIESVGRRPDHDQ